MPAPTSRRSALCSMKCWPGGGPSRKEPVPRAGADSGFRTAACESAGNTSRAGGAGADAVPVKNRDATLCFSR